MTQLKTKTQRVALFGAQAHEIEAIALRCDNLELVETDPDVVISYGGDGTLLAAELQWPGVPKVPILNSQRGHRCIHHPPEDVVTRLAAGEMVENHYTKLDCTIQFKSSLPERRYVTALNEINVHMGRINSALRFKLWIDEEPYEDGLEILGDGLILCTPFGSTAYFNKITRCAFQEGLGICFKATSQQTNHLVLPESKTIHVLMTRGPAILAFDSSQDYVSLDKGDKLLVRKHERGAIILTCERLVRLAEPF